MLTPKQRCFVEHYLTTWNAKESAVLAGYGSPQKTGYRLLHHPEVLELVNERLGEMGVSASEIVARMSQYARNNPANFFIFADVVERDPLTQQVLTDEDGNPIVRRQVRDIDWKTFEKYGYLVKKLSYDRKGRPVFEFYDAQRALETLGKYAKLDTELSKADVQSVEDLSAIADLIRNASDDGDA
jgi:hypothetical protein